jgi:hypothetical protein
MQQAQQLLSLTVTYRVEANMLPVWRMGLQDAVGDFKRVPVFDPADAEGSCVYRWSSLDGVVAPLGGAPGDYVPIASVTITLRNSLGECNVTLKAPAVDELPGTQIAQDLTFYDNVCRAFLRAGAETLGLPRAPDVLSTSVTALSFQFQSPKSSLNLSVLASHIGAVPSWSATFLSKVALMVSSGNPGLSYDATILNTGTVLVTTGAGVGSVARIYQEISAFIEEYIDLKTP